MQRPLIHAISGWLLGTQVEVARVYVGTFMTSLDMAGFSLTVLVLDDERVAALDADTQVCFLLSNAVKARMLCNLCAGIWSRSSRISLIGV